MKEYIVITGASGGMGRAISQILHTTYGIIAIGKHMDQLLNVMPDNSLDFITSELDISSPDWINKMDELLGDRSLHGIVNLAGISCGDNLEQLTDADWAYSFAVNVTAPMQLTRWAAPYLKKRNRGSIVNVGSPVGLLGARKSSYAASKSALMGLTMSTARELGEFNVRANLLLPGPTITDMTCDWSEEKRQNIANGSFLKRLCKPDEIAHVVQFLLSDNSSYMTGSTVDMTAGSMMGH